MQSRSPTAAGFGLIFRRPVYPLAEMAWRWSFGAAALAASVFILVEYLQSLAVGPTDLFLLRTRHPFFVSQAVAHILRGSAPRLVAAMLLAGIALGAAWIVLAGMGRSATVRGIVGHFRSEYPEEAENRTAAVSASAARPLLGLNFLRCATALAALIGWFGAFIVAGTASPDDASGPAVAMLVFAAVIMLLGLAWAATNWFLSLASVFAVLEGGDALGAISSAADFCLDRPGAVFAIGSWFGLAHLGAFIVGTAASFTVLAFAGVVPPGFVILAAGFVAAIYFAVADFLYTARLAAYLFAIEGLDCAVAEELPVPLPPASGELRPLVPEESAIDRTESILSDEDLILSDIPLPIS